MEKGEGKIVGKMLFWGCLVGRGNWGVRDFGGASWAHQKPIFPQFGEKMGEGRGRW